MTKAWRLLLVGAALPALLGASRAATPASATAAAAAAASRDVSRDVSRTASHVALHAAGDTMLVAARELPRGTVLRAGDVDTLVTDAAAATAGPATTAATSRADAPGAGWVVRRLVRKGEPLREPAVAPPALILAGSPVTLVWEVGGLRMTRTGTAVGPAYSGDRVVVRVDARRRFTGIATAPGTVVVSPP